MHEIHTGKNLNIQKSLLGITLISSILMGILLPLSHEWLFDKGEVEIILPENWRQMAIQDKLNCLDQGLSKNVPFPLLSEIQQFNIRRQFKKMIVDKKDGVLREGFKYHFSFRFHIGWKEWGLLGGFGFVSVWIFFGCVKITHLLIPCTPMTHFPAPPSSGRVESLHFLVARPTGGLPYVKISLFFFLVLEERFKKPEKPRRGGVE